MLESRSKAQKTRIRA